MHIFEDPDVDEKAIENAKLKTKESIASLFKVHTKSKLHSHRKIAEVKGNKPKEKFDTMIKKLLDREVANGESSTPIDKLFNGDKMILNYFLHKLLSMTNDPFFNKKHQVFLNHSNFLGNGPNFYERMKKDIVSL